MKKFSARTLLGFLFCLLGVQGAWAEEDVTLQSKIDAAGTTPTTIVLSKDYTENLTIAAWQDITLDLNGKTLTSANGKTVIEVNGKLTVDDRTATGEVTYNELENSIQNTYKSGVITGCTDGADKTGSQGGGILVKKDAELVFNNGTIKDNITYQGGAIFGKEGKITVNGGLFTGNQALRTSGGGGGAMYPMDCNCEINGGYFISNYAMRQGGAVFGAGLESEGNKRVINGGLFYGNRASTGGGIGDNGTLIIKGGIIAGNTAEYTGYSIISSGGVLVNYTAEVKFEGGRIVNNTTKSYAGDAEHEPIIAYGGGVANNAYNPFVLCHGVVIENNTLVGADNVAIANDIYLNKTNIELGSDLTDDDKIRIYSESSQNIMGINDYKFSASNFVSENSDLSVVVSSTNVLLSDNTLNADNAGCSMTFGDKQLYYKTIVKAFASLPSTDNVIELLNSHDMGGSCSLQPSQKVLLVCNTTNPVTLTNENANNVYFTLPEKSSLTVKGKIIIKGRFSADGALSGDGDGWQCFNVNSGAELTLGDKDAASPSNEYPQICYFNSTPSYFGAAVYAKSDALLNIYEGWYHHNKAKNGGAIYVNTPNAEGTTVYTINNARITDNIATNYGGGVFVNSGKEITYLENGKQTSYEPMKSACNGLVVNGTEISNNTAKECGGGLYVYSRLEAPTSLALGKGTVISSNSCSTYGAGVYAYAGTKTTIDGAKITDNRLTLASGTVVGPGFRLYNGGELMHYVDGVQVSYAPQKYVYSILEMLDGEISGNKGEQGATVQGSALWLGGYTNTKIKGGKVSGELYRNSWKTTTVSVSGGKFSNNVESFIEKNYYTSRANTDDDNVEYPYIVLPLDEIALTDGNAYTNPKAVEGVNISYTRTVKNKYGTIILPFVPEANDKVKYYMFSSADFDKSVVRLVEEKSPKANKPYIFIYQDEIAEGTIPTLTLTANSTTLYPNTPEDNVLNDWTMSGTYTTVEKSGKTDDFFYVNAKNGVIYKAEGTTNFAPYRAWATCNGSVNASALRIVIDGEVTGIATIEDGNISLNMGRIYDTSGRRVTAPQHGNVYIVNGKKIMY